ncbi:MAG: homoserine dehydrogenase [Gemmatimonadaceae bacterium]
MTSAVEVGTFEVNGWRDGAREAWPAPTRVRVALAGCGAVGSALLRELVARRGALAERHGVRVELTRVLVRDVTRPRDAEFDRSLLTADVDDFLATDADVVIEAIGGLDPARRIAESVLARGSELVTANKELLAAHGSALTALARFNRTSLRYDAAVGGGVPVLRLLDDALGAGTPVSVRGILNGTTNFVLTQIERGTSLERALREARSAGFAEADASRDLDGRDAAAKLSLVAWAAFGIAPEAIVVRRQSLLPDPTRYSALAAQVGRSVRQVAECAVVDGAVVASVEPLLLEPTSALARTRDEQNRVEVHTGWSAPLCASGPGAGGVPTATALLSDLVATGAAPRRHGNASVGGPDPRRFAWAIEARGPSQLLHQLVPDCGLVHTDATATRAWTIVSSATAAEIGRVVDALAAAGADPIAARLDDAEPRTHECAR